MTQTLPNGTTVERQSFEPWAVDFAAVGEISVSAPPTAEPETTVEIDGVLNDPRGETLQFLPVTVVVTDSDTGQEVDRQTVTVGAKGWSATTSFETTGTFEISAENPLPGRQSTEPWEEK